LFAGRASPPFFSGRSGFTGFVTSFWFARDRKELIFPSKDSQESHLSFCIRPKQMPSWRESRALFSLLPLKRKIMQGAYLSFFLEVEYLKSFPLSFPFLLLLV